MNIKQEELVMYPLPGYSTSYDHTIEAQRGGGVVIYSRYDLTIECKTLQATAAECIYGKISINDLHVHIIALYRPTRKSKKSFIEQLSILLRSVPKSDELIVIGDMNIDLYRNNKDSTSTINNCYTSTLSDAGLQCAIPSSEITREEIVDGRSAKYCIDHVWVRAGRSISGDSCADATTDELTIVRIGVWYIGSSRYR